MLNENGEPIDLHSASFTNIPAFKGYINPILNSESNEILNKEIISMDMTKEELREMITSIISEMKETEKTEEIKEEIKEEIIENECSEEMKDVVKNETTEEISEEKTEEVVEEKTEATNEVPVEETEKVEEKEEVIKIESLNSAPIIKDVEPEWKKLKGKEFLDWASKNPHYQI
jgi:phage I-like protein